MQDMRRSLPPLNAVRAFEVAARHLNFVRAAEELGVTQSAVSKQIAALEDFIGAKLFERGSGGVSLTLEGRELIHAVSPAFDALSDSFQRFSRKAPRSKKFRIATVASFAAKVLIPRMASFNEAMPDLELEILTSDRVLDLAREEVDLAVRYGAGGGEGVVAVPLDDGALTPVCAPRLFEEAGGDPAALLARCRRIQVFLKNEWLAFEKASGVRPADAPPPVVLEHFLVAAEAAIEGYGVALLPRLIVESAIAKGELAAFAAPVPWDQSFYLAYRSGADRRANVRKALAWLQSEV